MIFSEPLSNPKLMKLQPAFFIARKRGGLMLSKRASHPQEKFSLRLPISRQMLITLSGITQKLKSWI